MKTDHDHDRAFLATLRKASLYKLERLVERWPRRGRVPANWRWRALNVALLRRLRGE